MSSSTSNKADSGETIVLENDEDSKITLCAIDKIFNERRKKHQRYQTEYRYVIVYIEKSRQWRNNRPRKRSNLR